MLTVLVGCQKMEVSAEAQLKQGMIRAAILIGLLTAAIPIALGVFCSDNAVHLTTVYAVVSDLLFGYIVGIISVAGIGKRGKMIIVSCILIPMAAGMVSAVAVAGVGIIPSLGCVGLLFFLIGTATGLLI